MQCHHLGTFEYWFYLFFLLVNASTPRLATEQDRRRIVTAALDFTQPTALAATPYERQLLDQFVRGFLTIDEVLMHLEAK